MYKIPLGAEVTFNEVLEHMIIDSDNMAANILIRKLGGLETINTKIINEGNDDTILGREMLDQVALDKGIDNYTSVQDLGNTLKKMYNHQLISKEYDEKMLAILEKNKMHDKLLAEIPSEAKMFNKTGEFSTYGVQNDAAIVENSQGAFVMVVMCQDGTEQNQKNAMDYFGINLYNLILK